MKTPMYSYALIALTIIACQNDSDEIIPNQEMASVDMSDFYVYTDNDVSAKESKDSHGDKCYSMKVLNSQLKENPGLENRMYNIEKHTRTFISAKKGGNGGGGGGKGGGNTGDGSTQLPVVDGLGTINIPVYIYVVYSNSYGNLSDERIKSQITVLNNDFNDTNYGNIPAEFQGVAADVDINFTLAFIDRQANSTASWGYGTDVQTAYPSVPGHLTIWVTNISGGILGYAQFPGGNASTDGIVVTPQCFGSTGNLNVPYNKGRTVTHEVGHWLNLRHIWGDGKCSQDDFANDTPSSDQPNYGNPTYPTVNCRSNDMTMNYMDYTYDAYMNMFSKDQKNRMRAVFAPGGARENFKQ